MVQIKSAEEVRIERKEYLAYIKSLDQIDLIRLILNQQIYGKMIVGYHYLVFEFPVDCDEDLIISIIDELKSQGFSVERYNNTSEIYIEWTL